MAGHLGDEPVQDSGAIRSAIARNGRVQALAKAADDSPDSKGPSGTGKFGSFTPQDIRENANPYGTAATFEVSARGNLGTPPRPSGDMAQAIRQAAGVVPRGITLPEMAGNIFKAFVEAEGREPTSEDSEFFKAIVAVFDAHGEQVADEIRAAAMGVQGEPVQKAADHLTERFRKELGRDVPAWLKSMEAKHGDH